MLIFTCSYTGVTFNTTFCIIEIYSSHMYLHIRVQLCRANISTPASMLLSHNHKSWPCWCFTEHIGVRTIRMLGPEIFSLHMAPKVESKKATPLATLCYLRHHLDLCTFRSFHPNHVTVTNIFAIGVKWIHLDKHVHCTPPAKDLIWFLSTTLVFHQTTRCQNHRIFS